MICVLGLLTIILQVRRVDSLSYSTLIFLSGFKYGSYLYAGAKHIANKIGPKPTQIIAEIDSPPFVSTSKGGCAIRFYMMVNSYNASVTLELLDVSNGTRTLLMNYGRYVTDRYWRFSQSITPESLTTVYKVVITATMTASSSDYVMPYVALDDISFTRDCSIVSSGPTMVTLPNHRPVTTRRPDSCPIMSCLTANSTKICLTAGQLCDFVVDCKDGSDERNCGDCDFDDGKTCGWTNGGGDNRNLWKVIQPASRAPDHLPKVDASGNANGGFEAIYSSYPGILPSMCLCSHFYRFIMGLVQRSLQPISHCLVLKLTALPRLPARFNSRIEL